jgi:protein-S-isoprenylcysteine O-methyltransferase Ste14
MRKRGFADRSPWRLGSFLIKGAAGTVRSSLHSDVGNRTLQRFGLVSSKSKKSSGRHMSPAESHLSLCLKHVFLQPRVRLRSIMFIHFLCTPFVLLLLFAWYLPSSPEFWVYFALHSARAWLWILKNLCFPDFIFSKQKVTISGTFILFALLSLYWVAPWMLARNKQYFAIPFPVMAFFIACWGVGIGVNFAADAQKYFMLRERKVLVRDGVFSRCRHPAYFGDLLSYASMTMLSAHWLPFLIYVFFFITVFLPLIYRKEKNLSRYAEWPPYRSETGLLFPKVDRSYLRTVWDSYMKQSIDMTLECTNSHSKNPPKTRINGAGVGTTVSFHPESIVHQDHS